MGVTEKNLEGRIEVLEKAVEELKKALAAKDKKKD